jgi:hypothetical protein
VVFVRDDQPPAITSPAAGCNIDAKLNEDVILPEISASDNVSAQLKYNVFVIDPDDKICLVEFNKFKAAKKGVYRVLYTVADEAGNMSVVEGRATVR